MGSQTTEHVADEEDEEEEVNVAEVRVRELRRRNLGMENLIRDGEELEEDDSDDEDYLTAYVVPPGYARQSPLPKALGSPSVKVTIVLNRGLSEEFFGLR